MSFRSLLYRYDPNRALPPRVLTTPRVYALLLQRDDAGSLRDAIRKCVELADHAGSKLHGGYQGLGDYSVETLWSLAPYEPDLFVILGPGDAVPYWRLLTEFRKDRDPELLADLVPVTLV